MFDDPEVYYIIVRKDLRYSKGTPYCGILCHKAGFQGGQYYYSKECAEKHLAALNAVENSFMLAEVTDQTF